MSLTIPIARTKTGAVDDPDPNTTEPPDSEVIGGTQLRGIRGYLKFQTPPDTADVEFWVPNRHADADSANPWIFAGRLVATPDIEEWEHTAKAVQGSEVWIRLVNITGGDVEVFAEGF